MIEWIIGFLVAKWWVDKQEKEQSQEFSGNIVYDGIPFGYVKNGETVQDLQ